MNGYAHLHQQMRDQDLTPSQAAAYMGVSPSTVRRWLQEGRIKGIRVGGRLRITREDLAAAVKKTGVDNIR